MDFQSIESLAEESRADKGPVRRILERARRAKGLALEEAALLLNIEDEALFAELLSAASEVKQKIFGRRVVLFAPLYLSSYCTNGCLYCGFRAGGGGGPRKALSSEEVVREARALEAMGFKRVLLVTGEDPARGPDYIVSSVRAVYENTGMRIVHVNAPPMDGPALSEIKAAGVGVFQVFQETYHRETYRLMHPFGPKSDFDYRFTVMDRALSAGFRDVGIGPLFGLYDYRFDALSTIAHSMRLYERFGTHAHTISIPRLRPAPGSALKEAPRPVTDRELKKITAVFRLCIPSAGVVVSTREPAPLRAALLRAGASQMSAASSTEPGGYASASSAARQFNTDDHRGLLEVMVSIIEQGLVPSLCTTCYRVGRTGAEFTEKTKSGEMEKFCSANAALTIREFMEDSLVSKNGLKETFLKAIELSVSEIDDPALRRAVTEKLKEIERGRRDIHF